MNERTMSRSWTIAALSTVAGAAALAFGLFLAVGKESVAGDKVKVIESGDGRNVKVVKVVGDADAGTVSVVDGDSGRGGYLGIEVREDTKSSEGGALVEHVVDGSPADKAGLKDDDVIVGFGGDVIRGPGRLTEKIHGTKAGDKVVLDVRRDGKVQKLTVEMGERPKSVWAWSGDEGKLDPEQMKALEESLKGLDEKLPQLRENLGKMKFYAPGMHRMMVLGMDKPLLGIEMVETTPELREVLGGTKDSGVLVGKVLAGSAAEKAGIKVGDLIVSVDGDKVAGPGELAEAIRQHEGKTVDIDTVRDKKPVRVRVALPKVDEPDDEPTGPRASVRCLPRMLRPLRSLSA